MHLLSNRPAALPPLNPGDTRPDGKFYAEKFSGFVTRNGEIYFADHDRNGISLGKLTGPDAMEIYYIEDGADAKVFIDLLNRKKI